MRLCPSRNDQLNVAICAWPTVTRAAAFGPGCACLLQGHDRKDARDADDDHGALEDARRDQAECEAFVLPLEHREERDGSADAGEGDDRLEQAAHEEAVSPPTLRMKFGSVFTGP